MSSQTLTRQGTRSDLKWQEKVSKRRTERQLPIGHGEYTVLYPPGLAKMALGLAENLGDNLPVLCTDDIFSGGSIDETGLAWERFPSGDPNIKLRVDLIRDRHVVLLMNHDTIFLFEQLAVILFLQRFNVPHAKEQYARGKWKQTMADGAYDSCSVASLTIVVPWYRHCQMERTSRWTVTTGKWDNGKPDGEFVDVPTCQSFAAMLSALPLPPPARCAAPPPPQQLLLLDIHEYEDLEATLNSTGRWANRRREYDYVRGLGTYFASPFDRFLSTVLQPRVQEDPRRAFIVFPDHGAHRRFYQMVHRCIPGIQYENILWIDKTRVGADIVQAKSFSFVDAAGAEHPKTSNFPPGTFVLLADDFTNSGSTLFGGAEVIRTHADGAIKVCAYVSHYVAKYDRATVSKFVDKLYAGGALDEFHCSDSIPNVVAWLKEDAKLKMEAGAPQRVHVMQLAPLIGEWIKENHAATPRTPRREDAPPPPPPSEISIGSPRAVFGSGSGSDGGGGGGGGSGALASLAWLVLGIAVGLALGSRR
mmetsp:Transcript_38336/g.124701  ORF Transcript_38336/g.124701 Transcript_38336/m.124701 type:complete len:533 (+) Transcript_38336:58-1656(+)